MKTLKRITPYGEKMYETLIAVVPPSANPFEDQTTPRICVSTSTPGCLTAIAESTAEYLEDQRVRQFPFLMWIQEIPEASIPYNCIVTPQELADSGAVPDAIWTEEHWITNGTWHAPARLIRITNAIIKKVPNNPFPNQNKPYEVVVSCSFEEAVESFERSFSFCFHKIKDAMLCEEMILQINGIITKKKVVSLDEQDPDCQDTFLSWIVPSGVDVSLFWMLLYRVAEEQNALFEGLDWEYIRDTWAELEEINV